MTVFPTARHIDRMSQQGYNMVMTYRFRKAVTLSELPVPTPQELARFLAHCETAGIHVIFDFMWLMYDYSRCAAGATQCVCAGANCTLAEAESSFKEMVLAGARSRALLGWYT